MAATLWLQHACVLLVVIIFTTNACNLSSNTVGTSRDSCNASPTHVSVAVAEHRVN